MDLKGLFRTKSVHHILTEAANHQQGSSAMKRNLTVYDLTGLGIAAVIGAGIFSTIGNAATHGGPAVSVLFLFTAVACGFSALCYAQFASAIPISGSAYTYAYASFGELVAWIIGWDLIMEYAIGNIAVAISWSDYFTGLLGGIGIHFPQYLCIDYLSAFRGYHQALNGDSTRGHGIGTAFADAGCLQRLDQCTRHWRGSPHCRHSRFLHRGIHLGTCLHRDL